MSTYETQHKEFIESIQKLSEQMQSAAELMKSNADRLWFDFQRQSLMAKDMTEAFSRLSEHPELMQEYQLKLTEGLQAVFQHQVQFNDRRFNDQEWQQPGFQQLKDLYLNFEATTKDLINKIPDLDQDTHERVKFFTRQWLSAVAPSNYLLTNPVALAETQRSGGMNLLLGLKNYLEDLERGKGLNTIKMTDLEAFKPGKNLAVTPGKVIFQNDLIQLIQYTPTTKKVAKKPLLIVPPWINKYYILDLTPENSLAKWVVEQGQTLFMISWVNPDSSHRDKDFESYMTEGVLAAVEAVLETTGEQSLNALGYCLGGTLLGSTLAYMAAKNDKRIASATFFTTLLDFTYPGELGCFLSQEQLDILDQQMQAEGILDGRALALAYNMLREKDLHWNYHVNNYLMGRQPPKFDLLYWNADATNLPAAMHSFYLKNMYLENKLKEPGGIELDGVSIDLRKIDIPCYFLSAEKDHIALWKSTYLGAQLMGGEVEYVLAGSGHVAGVINPADSGKYCFFTNSKLEKTAEEWREKAEQTDGSWWSHWMEWLNNNNSEQVDARDPEKGQLLPLEDAPGAYVRKTIG
ncbi:MAG: class I poly(R)-hydroxyalkanoic acid synthase [Gammaproteobacteria bacterium]|nr:class I poly(R)-hydroxyalkanoic acid synthase [Gammaproteobacteria bacterium]